MMTAEVSDSGYLAVPASGKGAGVLVLHAWWGLNDVVRDVCNRLAREGYVALAPDLYHGDIATTIEGAEKLGSNMDQEQTKATLMEAVDQLRRHPAVTSESLAVLGFSLGGYWASWLSVAMPDTIRAVTIFYDAPPVDYAQARAAYLCHVGEADEWVPAPEVEALEESLRAAGRPATFYRYPGAGHWFFESDRPDAYREQAAALAWTRTLEFLRGPLANENGGTSRGA
jgi:carboxymethylenebutenolidase